LLNRRDEKDIWQKLYEYPLIETEQAMDFVELQQTEAYQNLMIGAGEIKVLKIIEMPKHVLSHRIIYARFYELEVSRFTSGMQAYLQVPEDELEKYAVSRLVELYQDIIA
jgi:A/G-specific adenine glycosylase